MKPLNKACPQLLLVLLVATQLVACGKRESAPAPRGTGTGASDAFDPRCVDTLQADLDVAIQGHADNANTARRPFKCAAGALGFFASRTRPANGQFYTAGELKVFAQRYLPSAAVTEAQIGGVLAVKNALLGGGESGLRADQLERVKAFLYFVGDEVAMLQGYLSSGTNWPLVQVRETWAMAALRWRERWGAGLQDLRIEALAALLSPSQWAQVRELKTVIWSGEADVFTADELRRTLVALPDFAAALVGLSVEGALVAKLPAARHAFQGWRSARGEAADRVSPLERNSLREFLKNTEVVEERTRNATLWLAARLLLEPLRDGGWRVSRAVQLLEAFADQPEVLTRTQEWVEAGLHAPIPFSSLLAVGSPLARLWSDRSGFSESFLAQLFQELEEFDSGFVRQLQPLRPVLLTLPRRVKRWFRAQAYLEDAYSRVGILESSALAQGLRGIEDLDLADWMERIPLHVAEGRGTVSFAATARRESRRTYADAAMAAFARELPLSLMAGEGAAGLNDIADIYTFSANGNQQAEEWESRELAIQLWSARELAWQMLGEFRAAGCAPADREQFSRACVERTYLQDPAAMIRLFARTFPRWNEERTEWADGQNAQFVERVSDQLFGQEGEKAGTAETFGVENLTRLALLLHVIESWITYSDSDGDGWLIGEAEIAHLFPFIVPRMRAAVPGVGDGNLYAAWGYMMNRGYMPTTGAMVGWRVSWGMRGVFHIYLELNRLKALGLISALMGSRGE